MAGLSFAGYSLLTVTFLASLASAVDTVKISGSNFVNNVTGGRFVPVGVDYQPGGSAGFDPSSGIDPLSNGKACLRDATLMQRLGVNAIRVYNLDPDLDHDECASIFNDAGIYMLLDVNSPLDGQSIDRTDPASTYDLSYLNRTFAVVEAFAPYPNTFGFLSGNEVINQDSTADAPLYIRAVTRDLKEYIAANIDRDISVGYSAADVSTLLSDTYNYLACSISNETGTTSEIDFFGLNDYSWCGNSSFTESGYDNLVSEFANSSIPVFFSEYGCNLVYPRVFTEVPVIYGSQMSELSGGFVYEYSNEVSDYGLVTINDNGTVSLLQDYDNLLAQYDTINVTALETVNSTATTQTAEACVTSLLTSGDFEASWGLPAQPSGVADLIKNGLSNPNKGKLVTITDFTPTQTIYAVNGSIISGMKLKDLGSSDESNEPGDNVSGSASGSASSGTSTATGSTSSSTSKSGAGLSLGKEGQSLGRLLAVAGALVLGLAMA